MSSLIVNRDFPADVSFGHHRHLYCADLMVSAMVGCLLVAFDIAADTAFQISPMCSAIMVVHALTVSCRSSRRTGLSSR